MEKNYCYNCTKRHVGCHSTCETYKEYLEEYKREKEHEKAIRLKERELGIYERIKHRRLSRTPW